MPKPKIAIASALLILLALPYTATTLPLNFKIVNPNCVGETSHSRLDTFSMLPSISSEVKTYG
jgi:hypothetical protein